MLYKNSILDYYKKLNTFQQSAQEKFDKSTSRNDQENLAQFMLQIRQVR